MSAWVRPTGAMTITSALRGVTLYVWTRQRRLIVITAAVYVGAWLTYPSIWSQVPGLAGFFRTAALLLPLIILAGTSFATKLSERASCYPRGLLTLPLTSFQLALPFMVLLVTLYVPLWAITTQLADQNSLLAFRYARGYDLLVQLALLAWAIVLLWLPAQSRSGNAARVIAVYALVIAAAGSAWIVSQVVNGPIVVVPVGWISTLSQLAASPLGIMILVAQLPLSSLASTWAVARARGGAREPASGPESNRSASPEGESESARAVELDAVLRRDRAAELHFIDKHAPRRMDAVKRAARSAGPPRFRSAGDAQAWFERRMAWARGKVPLLTPLVVILLMSLVTLLEPPATPESAQRSFKFLLVWPIFIIFAGAIATAQMQSGATQHPSFRLPSFLAVLPRSSGALAWTRLVLAAQIALVLIVVWTGFAAAIALTTGVAELWLALLEPRRVALGAFWSVALLALTALLFFAAVAAAAANLVWLGLTGRGWIFWTTMIPGAVLCWSLAFHVITSGPDRVLRFMSAALPLLSWVAAAKLVMLGVLGYRAGARGGYSRTRAASILTCWIAAVAVAWLVYAAWADPAAAHGLSAVTIIIIATPALGILAAPLALQWNRCRG